MLLYNYTAIQEIEEDLFREAGVRLLIKREDLNHPYISGNKWWKLKYNLEKALASSHKTVLTFGGAFSNHIYATAAACDEVQLKSIGIIRGERVEPLNNTLQFATNKGMDLHFVSRSEYRNKNDKHFIDYLHSHYGNFHLVPEGGSNLDAVKGCKEFTEQELLNLAYDYIVLPVGTGGTAAGILCGLDHKKQLIGISVLKDGEFLNGEVLSMAEAFSGKKYKNFQLLTAYDHGGYAKVNRELIDFIRAMKAKHGLPLDPIYTGKMMWAIYKEIADGKFEKGSTLLAIHTGGLQGAASLMKEA
ncbi:1-aminocyclopropane-1-carboxylate deaminase/D-cysteine desulfhydrase [Chryseosolibacter indicus]|uniref:Pyridoxal-phosphate dependent enzyme n=1 Tax=Chryseosolibacter indicus TaxID=2782351 RepID=A0ABS5VSR7_9BACT|nr:pyridoxal-phosphate dependent enzyme [Chryseosolibacter indicus]MBT1704231.1 pyridoxal-phosphate dependent enzyme [Chryseosolibacter indicus]